MWCARVNLFSGPNIQEHGSEIAQRGDRDASRSKRSHAGNRRSENDDVPVALLSKEPKPESVLEEVSSGEEEGQPRRGRSKTERWNSRRERVIPATSGADGKRHRRQSRARETDLTNEPRNADQHTIEKRQVRYRLPCFSVIRIP